jgi:hypothetical protein
MYGCVILLYDTYFAGSPSGEAAKTGIILKNPVYSSINRGTYGLMFQPRNIWTRGRGAGAKAGRGAVYSLVTCNR